MPSTSFEKELRELYDGELLGEAFFEILIQTYPDQKQKLITALQLETETKARLRPFLVKAGIPLNDIGEARNSGYELATAFQGLTWESAMQQLVEVLKPAVDRYQEILTSAPAEYRDLADSMLIHEESLLKFAMLELEPAGEDSLLAINEQLVFKIQN